MTKPKKTPPSPGEPARWQSSPSQRKGRRRKGGYDFASRDKKGHLTVTLEKYREKRVDYVMAASGRIQYDSNKPSQRFDKELN
jgi:hypothetical protein